jgi:stage II sporulation protein D
MRHSLASRVISVVLVHCFFVCSIASAQQGREESRPRRTDPRKQEQEAGAGRTSAKPASSTNQSGPWRIQESSITKIDPASALTNGAEPAIRVALATDARSANISTTGRLMKATDVATTLVPLDVARVHVEPHLLSPLPTGADTETFRLRIAGLASRSEADQQAKQIREATGEESTPAFDAETQTWGLLVGPRRSRVDAEAVQGRLEEAGFEAAIIDLSAPSESSRAVSNGAAASAVRNESTVGSSPVQFKTLPSTNSSNTSSSATKVTSGKNGRVATATAGGDARAPSDKNVRLAARTSVPTRELVASAIGTRPLFSSSAPVVFASEDEAKAPVRFNDKPYRGRIEVFANSRGLLTVVNVLGLEDYVRGVVANELSPGGYPALEALKAQAIAARTYALKNRGQFMSQGFDLLPTTRSQVYRGLTSEHPLSTRAVDETRGLIATYNGEPINALYTSTCGGRTEDAENIFNEAVPYLRGRECAVEGKAAFAPFTIKTSREPGELREEKHVESAREIAMLATHNFGSLPGRVSDSWLSSAASLAEVRAWLGSVAALAHHSLPVLPDDANRPPAFATALNATAFGESRADTLLNNADVEYFLAIRDANEVPAANRADVALMVRDGYLSLFPDASLHPREVMSRARVLHAIARLLETRGLLQMQKGTTRPAANDMLVLRSNKGKDQQIRVSADVFLFRQIGDAIYPVRSVSLIGGEPVIFHVNGTGAVDYLEVRPAPNGAAADRFSPFTNWTSELSLAQVRSRLAHSAQSIGPIVDLRIVSRGSSRRVTDLEIIGAGGNAHIRGGRIRSALGLREQLFVIDREYDSEGHITRFVFTGRGWGHGVGMCQVGAYGLAKQGWSYERILKAYYTGIEITRLY